MSTQTKKVVKNYYGELGVAETAAIEEIKKAFRRLSKEHHPDNPNVTDEGERFRRIDEAYKTLSDPAMRKAYDEFLETVDKSKYSFADLFSVFETRMLFSFPGEDIHITVPYTAADVLQNKTVTVPFIKRCACSNCKGEGWKYEHGKSSVCPDCNQGRVRKKRVERTPFGSISVNDPCPTCEGKGIMEPVPCEACGKKGFIEKEQTFSHTFLRPVEDGEILRLDYAGHDGKMARTGDLLVTFQYADAMYPMNQFGDIEYNHSVSIADFGKNIDIPLPDGTKESIPLPYSWKPEGVMCLSEKGIWKDGRRGVLNVTFSLSWDGINEQVIRIAQKEMQ